MKLELLTAPDDGFIIGRDLIGYGKLGDDTDTWTDITDSAGEIRASRGTEAGLLTVQLRDAAPDTDLRLRVGRRCRIYDPDRGHVLWYGRITGVPAVEYYDKDTGDDYSIVTLTAGDVVAEATNNQVGNIGAPGVRDTLRQRVARIGAVATVPLVHTWTNPPDEPVPPAGWTNPLRTPTATTGGAYLEGSALDWDNAGVQQGLWITLDGLEPDAVYTFTAQAAYTEAGDPGTVALWTDEPGTPLQLAGWNIAADPEPAPVGPTILTATLRPTGTTCGLYILGFYVGTHAYDHTRRIEITAATVTQIQPPGLLQATAYEASAIDHLDTACNSITGSRWRATLDGTLEVTENAPVGPLVAVISDTNLGISATEICLGYDAFVNDLTITNRGLAGDDTTTYTDALSIASYGRSASQFDTCLADQWRVPLVAGARFAAASTPEWAPTEVTYLYDDLGITPDKHDRVGVSRRGRLWTCEVIDIHHRIIPDPDEPTGTARRHLVTLTLRKA